MAGRRAALTAIAWLVVVLTSGCSSADDEKAPEAPSGLPSRAQLATYFDAVASYDPERLSAAEPIASRGSPAEDYAAYLAELSTSAIAGAQPVAGADAEAVKGGYRACGGTATPDGCATWADLEGTAGKLTDFTVNGVRLDDSLVDLTGQAPIRSPGLYTVQPEHAYRSPMSDTLFVTVTVTAEDVALSPRPGFYIEADQDIDGIPTWAPRTIQAGTSTPVLLAFPHAEETALTGAVTFGLRVGTDLQSVGFDLARP